MSSQPNPQKSDAYKEVPNVVKKDKKFYCGICRKGYSTYKDSLNCLAKCLNGYFQRTKIKVLKKGDQVLYHCNICGKTHKVKETAIKCYSTDKQSIIRAVKNELDKHKVVPTKSSERKKPQKPNVFRIKGQKPFYRNAAKYACNACHENYFTKDEVIACFTSHPEKGGSEVIDPASQEAEAKVKNVAQTDEESPVEETIDKAAREAMERAQKFFRKKGQEPFHRDGAKYICNACKTVFYTKFQVEDCFKSHPESDEYV